MEISTDFRHISDDVFLWLTQWNTYGSYAAEILHYLCLGYDRMTSLKSCLAKKTLFLPEWVIVFVHWFLDWWNWLWEEYMLIQTYLWAIASLTPDHCNKASNVIKPVVGLTFSLLKKKKEKGKKRQHLCGEVQWRAIKWGMPVLFLTALFRCNWHSGSIYFDKLI